MKFAPAKLLVAGLLLVAVTGAASAMIIETPYSTITRESSHVLRGRVLSMESAWNAEHTTIVTQVVIEVGDSFKGDFAKSSRLELSVEGGEVGEFGVRVEHAPQFELQEDVFLFLQSDEQGKLRVSYDEQGKLSVVEGHVLNQLHDPVPLAQFLPEITQHIAEEERR